MIGLLATRQLQQQLAQAQYQAGRDTVQAVKIASAPEKSYSLTGRLYLSDSGWLLLSVPNSLVRGAFDALQEPGAELPPRSNGQLNAHISIMTKRELEALGGGDKITERGHSFNYSLAGFRAVDPVGWPEMSKVWFCQVDSPALKQLRQSYGLEPLPNGHKFHITVAVRRKGVTANNGVTKGASGEKPRQKVVAVDLDGTILEKLSPHKDGVYGQPREGARAALQKLKDEGHKIVINTCRGDRDEVAAYLKKHDIPHDHVNENPDQPDGVADNKIMADIYVDDRAIDARPPWAELLPAIRARLKKQAEHPYVAKVEAAVKDVHPSPSEAQKEVGNYAKGHVHLHGLDITIETPKGGVRSGTAKDGTTWSITLPHSYGYIKRTESEADGDHIDVFIGPHPQSELVFVVDQNNPGGKFDEHKVCLGFFTKDEAKQGYLDSYSKGWKGYAGMTAMTMKDFKEWAFKGDTSKPLCKQAASRWRTDANLPSLLQRLGIAPLRNKRLQAIEDVSRALGNSAVSRGVQHKIQSLAPAELPNAATLSSPPAVLWRGHSHPDPAQGGYPTLTHASPFLSVARAYGDAGEIWHRTPAGNATWRLLSSYAARPGQRYWAPGAMEMGHPVPSPRGGTVTLNVPQLPGRTFGEIQQAAEALPPPGSWLTRLFGRLRGQPLQTAITPYNTQKVLGAYTPPIERPLLWNRVADPIAHETNVRGATPTQRYLVPGRQIDGPTVPALEVPFTPANDAFLHQVQRELPPRKTASFMEQLQLGRPIQPPAALQALFAPTKVAASRWRTPEGLMAIWNRIRARNPERWADPLRPFARGQAIPATRSETLSLARSHLHGADVPGSYELPGLKALREELPWRPSLLADYTQRLHSDPVTPPKWLVRGIGSHDPWLGQPRIPDQPTARHGSPFHNNVYEYAAESPLGKLLSIHRATPTQQYTRDFGLERGRPTYTWAEAQKQPVGIIQAAYETAMTPEANPSLMRVLTSGTNVARVPKTPRWQSILQRLYPVRTEERNPFHPEVKLGAVIPAAEKLLSRPLAALGRILSAKLPGQLPALNARAEEDALLRESRLKNLLTLGLHRAVPGFQVKDQLIGGGLGAAAGLGAEAITAGDNQDARAGRRALFAGLGGLAGGTSTNAAMNVARRYIANTSPLSNYRLEQVPGFSARNLWEAGVKDRRLNRTGRIPDDARYELLRRYLGVHQPDKVNDLFRQRADASLHYNPVTVRPGTAAHKALIASPGESYSTAASGVKDLHTSPAYSADSLKNPFNAVFGSHDMRTTPGTGAVTGSGMSVDRELGDAWNFAIDPHERPLVRNLLGDLFQQPLSKWKQHLSQRVSLDPNIPTAIADTAAESLKTYGLRQLMESVFRKETPVIRQRLRYHYDAPTSGGSMPAKQVEMLP